MTFATERETMATAPSHYCFLVLSAMKFKATPSVLRCTNLSIVSKNCAASIKMILPIHA
jgi:hypothetical protein